jgi:peroxiredoxin
MGVKGTIAMLALLLAPVAAHATPEVGMPAPDFTLMDSNGVERSLSDYRGERVILEWTNDGCPYVGKHYGTGNMQRLQRDATEDGTIWLSIISSAPGRQGYVSGEEANTLTASRGAYPTAVLFDPDGHVGHAYDARTTPDMYLIDEEGILRYMGAIDDQPTARHSSVEGATNYVREALSDLDAGREVRIPETQPYGCSIKYR